MCLSLRLKGFRAFRLPLPQFLRILVEFKFSPEELPPGWDEHPLLPSAITCSSSGQARASGEVHLPCVDHICARGEVHLPCVDCIVTGIFRSSPTGGRRGTRPEEGCELGALCSQSLFMFRCGGLRLRSLDFWELAQSRPHFRTT